MCAREEWDAIFEKFISYDPQGLQDPRPYNTDLRPKTLDPTIQTQDSKQ